MQVLPFNPNRICRACLSPNIRLYAEIGLKAQHLRCVCTECGNRWQEKFPTEEEYEAASAAAKKRGEKVWPSEEE